MLILRTRFQDTKDRKVLFKRRDDWIKDLNMNLVKGKVIRSSHYFDELTERDQIGLLRALETEQGSREEKDCALIEPFVRSISMFKPYAEFESGDFQNIFQEMKLHKVRKGTRITNFGENADTIYLVVSGRIAITHPNAELIQLYNEGGPKLVKDRCQGMTEKQVNKLQRMKTFITAQGGGLNGGQDEEQMRNQRLEEAKTNNKTF